MPYYGGSFEQRQEKNIGYALSGAKLLELAES